MGNQVDKTHGGRGQALGTSQTNEPQKKEQPSKKKRFKLKKKKKQPTSHPIYHSREEQRAARANLVTTKKKNITSELNKKEKILHIMEAADAVKDGKTPPPAPINRKEQNGSSSSLKSSPYKSPSTSSSSITNKSNNKSSVYMADPSSKEALAAEQRIQTKIRGKKKSNIDDRKQRTKDLLFGDALNKKVESNTNESHNKPSTTTTTTSSKSEKSVFVSNSKQAEAALNRLSQQKSGKIVNQKDRKQRTMNLVHGDLLKNADEVKVEPRQMKYDDVDADIAEVHQSIINLNICNQSEKLPNTAKLLRKVVGNLLKAETKEDQEKYGKLRLTNKKIKIAFVDMQYGVETLQSLGFIKKKIYNDKEMKMDDYMIFDFININYKALTHVTDLLNEYYPEQ